MSPERPTPAVARRRLGAALALVALSLPARSLAQPAPGPERAQLLAQAEAAQNAGDHARARDLLRAAARLGPSLNLQWAIAFESLALGDLANARREAEACVEEAARRSAGRSPPREVATVSAQCALILVQVHRRESAPAPVGPAPDATVEAPPVAVPAAAPAPPPTRTDAPPPRRGPGAGPVVLLAAGGAGLATAAVLGLLRGSALSACAVEGDVATCPTEADLADARRAPGYALAGNVALGVGAAAVAAGALWWALGRRGERVAAWITPSGAGLAGRF